MKKLIVFVLLIGMIFAAESAFAGGGQSGGGAKPITLRVFYGFADFEAPLTQLAKTYKERNPNVTVELISGADAQILAAMVQQRDYPNIALIPDGFDTIYGRQGLLLDLSNRPIASRATADNLATHWVDGKIYSISTGAGVYGIYYNKALFRQAGIDREPATLSELKAAVAKLKAAGITPFVGGYKDSWPQGQYFRWGSAGAFTKNAPITEDIAARKRKFNDPAVISMFNGTFELIDLIKNNMTADSLLMTSGEAEVKFGQGVAAMYMLGDWSMAVMESANPNAAKREVTGFMPLLTSDNAVDNRYLVFFNQGHGIFKDSQNVDEAIKFYDFMFSKEGSEVICRATGNPGPFTDSDLSWANEFKQDMMAQITKPNRTWNDMEFLKLPPIFAGLDSALDGYMKGAYGKNQVFDELQKAVETALAAQ